MTENEECSECIEKNNEIDDLEEQVSGLKSDIQDLQEQLSALELDISDLEANEIELKEENDYLKDSLKGLKNSINKLSTKCFFEDFVTHVNEVIKEADDIEVEE